MTSKNGKQKMNQYFSRALLGLGAFLLATLNVQAADLQAVDFSSLPGDKTQVEITFSEAVSSPKSFSIDEPARVVLDFAGVQNKLSQKTQQVNIGATQSVSTIEAGGRTRMVFNLNQSAPYVIKQQGNRILVTISAGSTQAVATPTAVITSASTARADNQPRVTDIDFRRGEDGAGRIMLSVNQQGMPIDVHQKSNRIVIDMPNMTLPDSLHRRLDVIDFGTPVKMIDSAQKGRDTQLIISTLADFEYLSYQTDTNFVVEVKPISKQDEAEARRAKRGYHGEKLSLNFQDVEVRAVLQILADFTGLNLVTSDAVSGNITLRLKNVPWDQALDIIMKTKGLAKRDNGNVILIAPASEFAISEKQELEAKNQLIQLETLYSEIMVVNFAKASDMALLLTGKSATDEGGGNSDSAGGESFLSGRGSVSVDGRTNSLLLRDTADRLELMKGLVKTLDVPVRQVLIESRIVIANNDFSKELGVRFGVSKRKQSNGRYVSDGITSGSLNGTTQIINGETLEMDDRLNVNLPVQNPAGQIALALSKLPLGLLLELELSAMQEEGNGEIISSPKVITSNRHKGLIEQGIEIPYLEASSSGSATISFKKAVLKLEVTPQITPDDHIILDLAIHKDEAVFDPRFPTPAIDTRKVITQILIDNGETVVLGGVYEETVSNTSARVPFLGDLPMVGRLFRSELRDDKKRELLIFVTPKIIKNSMKL